MAFMISPQLNGITLEDVKNCWDISKEVIGLPSKLQVKEGTKRW